MGEVTLNQVLAQVRELRPEDRRRLRNILDSLPESPAAPPTEEEFEQELVRLGMLGAVPPPITDLEPYRNRRLVEIKGQPLSETIIEERR